METQKESIAPAIVDTNHNDLGSELKTADTLLQDQEARIAKYKGKKFIGLCQKTIPKLDEKLSGLRKFIILAAEPNAGKTALTIQLGLDVLKNNTNTCLLYISLEMTREEILDRVRCNLAKISYTTLMFGSTQDDQGRWYSKDEQDRLDKSAGIIQSLGKRILIIDEETHPAITVDKIVQLIENLKTETKCQHAMVIIDYLQEFPVPVDGKFFSENDVDKFRANQMKHLRKKMDGDPLIVISEARKPSGKDQKNWATSKADILGSGKTAFKADAILLIKPITDPNDYTTNGLDEKTREILEEIGQSLVRLTLDKGRDGMTRGDILLLYHFYENRFEETTWQQLQNSLKKIPNTNNNPTDLSYYNRSIQ